MKKLNENLYNIIKKSLEGKNIEEKIDQIEMKIFANDMKDRWEQSDYEYNDVLYKIKNELEEELNAKQN